MAFTNTTNATTSTTAGASDNNNSDTKQQELGVVCHMLPCAIEYEGMAPVHVYFHPTPPPSSSSPSSEEETSSMKNTATATSTAASTDVWQAQIRGRKLVAAPAVSLPGMIFTPSAGHGAAANSDVGSGGGSPSIRTKTTTTSSSSRRSIDNHNTHNNTFTTPTATFDGIQEWHHEERLLVGSTTNSRITTALEWCQVSAAIHDDIPLPG